MDERRTRDHVQQHAGRRCPRRLRCGCGGFLRGAATAGTADRPGLAPAAVTAAEVRGDLFFVLPCVSATLVSPTPAWLFPGPSNVVQVTVPWSLMQLSGSGAAPDEATGISARQKTSAQKTASFFLEASFRGGMHGFGLGVRANCESRFSRSEFRQIAGVWCLRAARRRSRADPSGSSARRDEAQARR